MDSPSGAVRFLLPLLLALGVGILFSGCVSDRTLQKQLAFSEAGRGGLLVELGREAEAYGPYRRAAELEPENNGYLYEASRLALLAGDVSWGLEGALRLRQRLPDNMLVLELLAYGYAASGDTEGALGYYREIVSLRGSYTPALKNMALLFQKMDEPVAAYKTMVEIAEGAESGGGSSRDAEPLSREFWLRMADLARGFRAALGDGFARTALGGAPGADTSGKNVEEVQGVQEEQEEQEISADGYLISAQEGKAGEAVLPSTSLLAEEIRWLEAALKAEPSIRLDAQPEQTGEESVEESGDESGGQSGKPKERDQEKEQLLLRLARAWLRQDDPDSAEMIFREFFGITDGMVKVLPDVFRTAELSESPLMKALLALPGRLGGEEKRALLFEYAWLLLARGGDYALGLPVLSAALDSGFRDTEAVKSLLSDPLLFDPDVVESMVSEKIGADFLKRADGAVDQAEELPGKDDER